MDSGQDSPGAFVKFANPTVANGKVYVPTLSDAVAVYGLLSGDGGGALSVSAIVDAASGAAGPVAPGELIALYGSGMGPDSPAGMEFTAGGGVSTYLGGTRVLFGETPAPLLYASGGQVNTVVPFGLASASSQLQIEYQGRRSNPVTVPIVPAYPAIFSTDGSGTGQGQVLNADGSANSTSNPAAWGSAILIFATGGGQTSPAGQDGALSTETQAPSPVLPVSAQIGGQPALVLSATGAPGAVQGVIQVTLQVPDQTVPGSATPISPAVISLAPISITIGGRSSQAGLFVVIGDPSP